MKKNKILVTGGSGFIGSHLVKKLLQEGYEVAITTKYESVYENIRLFNIWKKIKIIECDLRYSNSISKINDFNPKIIFHLGAYNDVKGSFSNYHDALDSNIIGTANLLENLKKYEQFIYISSSEVYGHQKKNIVFSEDLIPHPISPYSIGKYSGELYAQMQMRHMKKPIKILRPFNVFGEGQSNKAVIPELIQGFLDNKEVRITKGTQTREFNYVINTINFFINAIKSNLFFNNIVNVSEGKELAILSLANKIKKLAKSKSKIVSSGIPERKTEIHRMKASIKKMKLFFPKKKIISFEDGLMRTINWYKQEKKLFSNF